MYSKNDSNATYCSEVEDLLKAATATPNTSCINMPLRRSQRLSEKRKDFTIFSPNNVRFTRCAKPSSLKTFSTRDLKMQEKMVSKEDIRLSFNKILGCSSKGVDCIPVTIGVPLDLSNKSKVSTIKTQEGQLELANANTELRSCSTKNGFEIRKKYEENAHSANISKPQLLYINKPRRQRKYIKKCAKEVADLYIQSSIIQNAVENMHCCEKISSDVDNFCNRTYKKNQPLKKNISLISGKRIKLSNGLFDNLAESSRAPAKLPEQKLSNKDKPKKTIKSKSSCNENYKRQQPLRTVSVKKINRSQEILDDNTNLYKRNCDSHSSLKENSTLISSKTIRLSNKSITTNKLKNKKKLPELENFTKSKDKLNKLASEIRKPAFQNNYEACVSKIQRFKRSQKRNSQSDTNFSKTKTRSNEIQYLKQNIKSEPVTSGETVTTNDLVENSFVTKVLTNKLQKNSSQVKHEASTCNQTVNEKSSGEIKSYRILRSVTSPIINNTLSDKTIENNSCKFENECKNVKTEIFSQIPIVGKHQSNISKRMCSFRKTKTVSCSYINGEQLNSNEFRNVNLNTESNSKSSIGIRDLNAAKESIEKMNQPDKNVQLKTEGNSTMSILHKNYIKAFDRNQFLDKIQNSRNYNDQVLAYSKRNTFEVPPTPAESSEDLLKLSILPDVYPPHFKHQLPPEAVLSRYSNLHAHPTCVITPEDTTSSELLDSSSSSPSLPESLCELLKTKDIKDILNVDKVSYRLFNYHIRALALILNLRLEYLYKILDKITNISPNVLKDIDKAVKMPLVPDNDIFITSPDKLWESSDIVFNSQSPKQRRISTIANRTRC